MEHVAAFGVDDTEGKDMDSESVGTEVLAACLQSGAPTPILKAVANMEDQLDCWVQRIGQVSFSTNQWAPTPTTGNLHMASIRAQKIVGDN